MTTSAPGNDSGGPEGQTGEWERQVRIECPRCGRLMRYVASHRGLPESFRCRPPCKFLFRLKEADHGEGERMVLPLFLPLHVNKAELVREVRCGPSPAEIEERKSVLRQWRLEMRRLTVLSEPDRLVFLNRSAAPGGLSEVVSEEERKHGFSVREERRIRLTWDGRTGFYVPTPRKAS